ncbi:MAG TPA: NB-ARC domain-containing protein [Candidatus Acidoferrum sp.]|nr:NB-ARC domain-containing protein [Candidatus Acidoferrum sp.]
MEHYVERPLLETQLFRLGRQCRTIVLHGLRGCGKTSVMKKYLQRRASTARIYWVTMGENGPDYGKALQRMEAEVNHAHHMLERCQDEWMVEPRKRFLRYREERLRSSGEPEGEDLLKLLKMLHIDTGWIIVFDNIDRHCVVDPQLIKLASDCKGLIIMTTRDALYPQQAWVEASIAVGPMEEAEGCALLERLTDDTDLESARAIVHELGGYCASLALVGKLVRSEQSSLAAWQKILAGIHKDALLYYKSSWWFNPVAVPISILDDLKALKVLDSAAYQWLKSWSASKPAALEASSFASKAGEEIVQALSRFSFIEYFVREQQTYARIAPVVMSVLSSVFCWPY